MSKLAERHAKQTGIEYIGKKYDNDPIDNYIDSNMLVRRFFYEYKKLKEEEEKKKKYEEELREKLQKEYEEKLQKDVVNRVVDSLKL